MTNSQTFSTLLNCTIADITIGETPETSLTHLNQHEPFKLSANLTFSDEVDNHFAQLLMPLGLAIRVTFYAKPSNHPGAQVDLGTTVLNTVADTFTYTPTLTIDNGAAAVGLRPEIIYTIAVIVRVGQPPFSLPSLVRGFIEGSDLQINNPDPQPKRRKAQITSANEELTDLEETDDPEAVITRLKVSRRKSASPKDNAKPRNSEEK